MAPRSDIDSPEKIFWKLTHKGAAATAVKSATELDRFSDPSGPGQAGLAEEAVEEKADGIAVPLPEPGTMRGAVTKTKKAGIPVTA